MSGLAVGAVAGGWGLLREVEGVARGGKGWLREVGGGQLGVVRGGVGCLLVAACGWGWFGVVKDWQQVVGTGVRW